MSAAASVIARTVEVNPDVDALTPSYVVCLTRS